MKKTLITSLVLAVALLTQAPTCSARALRRPDPILRSSVTRYLEEDSLHNLDVARHYFKLKKAYVAAIKRCEEIDAGNPTFSKMDEVLFIAGESSLRLAENKGKQKAPKDKTPEQLQQDARVYLTRLVTGYPNSAFFKQAQTDLAALGGPIKLEDSRE